MRLPIDPHLVTDLPSGFKKVSLRVKYGKALVCCLLVRILKKSSGRVMWCRRALKDSSLIDSKKLLFWGTTPFMTLLLLANLTAVVALVCLQQSLSTKWALNISIWATAQSKILLKNKFEHFNCTTSCTYLEKPARYRTLFYFTNIERRSTEAAIIEKLYESTFIRVRELNFIFSLVSWPQIPAVCCCHYVCK
jgi:hypothetical protein